MTSYKGLVAGLLLAGAASAASADVLVLNDGRTFQGQVLSVNTNRVRFLDERGGQRDRTVSFRVDQVDRIEFGNVDVSDDDDSYYGGSRGYGSGRPGDFDREVYVNAAERWTDSGINVRAGDVLRFDATGTVNWGPGRVDGPAGERNSPFNSSRPLPNRAGAGLIGKVGSGAPFFIGSDTGSFRVTTSGRLYLGVNDDYLGDNSGSFRVMVTR